jgi:hypothetical protein
MGDSRWGLSPFRGRLLRFRDGQHFGQRLPASVSAQFGKSVHVVTEQG